MGWFSSLVGGVVGFFVGGPVGAVVGAGLGATKAGEKIVNAVVDFVVQPFMGLLGGAPEIGNETERQQGVLVTRRAGGATSVPVVYGLRKVGGLITFAETGPATSTPANKYLWVIYVLSEGAVEGLYELYIDDNQLPGSAIGQLNAGQVVNITEGKYNGRVSMQFYKGVYHSTPSNSQVGNIIKGNLFAECPSYKNTMIYNGLATLFVRYEWKEVKTQADADANPFSGSIPEIGAVLLGRKVASLVTTTSEGIEYGAAGYSERYSTNPAEILLDYLRNPRYGKGMKNSEIDWASFRTAAAKCNTEVTYTTTNIKGPIMTCNYVLDTDYTIFQNVKILLQGFRAYMPYVQGRYKLKIEDAGNETDILSGSATIVAECLGSAQVFDASLLDNAYEIMGDVVYTGIDRSSKYNQVVVTYVDPRLEYKWSNQQVVFPETEAERQTFITADGGRENKLEITMPTVTNYAMAKDFARILFNKSRYAETATLRVSSQAFELEPGDNIRIQNRILNFGDVPWRVIGIQHNSDYTFDLACVRNPDFIYPYTRVGEPDRVLPIFVPKGATVFYPKEVDRPDLSLVPPTSATSGGGGFNPGGTNPTDPDGGGVGGPGGTNNTLGQNDTPPTAPKPLPLDNVIDVTNVTYLDKNGLNYVRLTYKQPNHAMFAGVSFYWRINGSRGSFQNYEDTQIPGIGNSIFTEIGPLATVASLQDFANEYVIFARVKYSTGEVSTRFVSFTLNPVTKSSAGGNVTEAVSLTATSWPTIVIADNTRRDNKIDVIEGLIPSLTTPRSLNITLAQDIRTQDINYDVDGVNIYYKNSTETYWSVSKVKFAAPYAPGNKTTFSFPGNIGVPGGPATYSFIFRLTYKDGTESSNQFVINCFVENATFSYPVNPFYGIGIAPLASPPTGHMAASRFEVITTDMAPPGAVAQPKDTKIGINGVYLLSSTAQWQFVLEAPNNTFYRGVRFTTRPLTVGSTTSTRTFLGAEAQPNPQGLTNGPLNLGLKFDGTPYEVVITPQVVDGNTTAINANSSLIGSGYLTNDRTDPLYPQNSMNNWVSNFRFEQMDTQKALQQLSTAISASGVVSVTSCKSYRLTVPNQNQIKEYIELQFDSTGIANYQDLYIYRRTFARNDGTTNSTFANYTGVGRWERVIVTGSGAQTVNLRFATHFEEFNLYFERNRTTFGTQLITNWANSFVPPTLIAVNDGTSGIQQLLLVARTSAGLSSRGLLITGQTRSATSSITDWLINAQGYTVRPLEITYASYPNIQDADFIAGYGRRISEARTTALAFNQIYYRDSVTNARAWIGTTTYPDGGTFRLVESYPTPRSGPAIV